MRQLEGNLQKEMRQIEVNLQKDMRQLEVQLARAMHRQTLWVVGSIGSIIALVRLLDWFLTHSIH